MRFQHTFLVLAAAAAAAMPVASCSCGVEPLQVLKPLIAIGDPVNPAFSVCTAGDATGKFRECTFDFGDVVAGGAAVFSFSIEDVGRGPLSISRVATVGSPRFALDGEAPALVATGASSTVTVRYSPEAAAAETADVVITSDAANLDAGEDVVIHLKAHGQDAGAPSLVVDPGACDFGAVGVGVRASCAISLRNDGTLELDVSSLALAPSSSAAFTLDAVTAPLAIGPGTAVSVVVFATPSSLDPQSGTLVVESNDPARPSVDVPLTVSGAEAPTAVARVARINGVDNTSPSPAVEPLDDVVLSADQSIGFGAAASIASYQWTILERPAESSVSLSAENEVETGFVFSSAAGDVAGVDVAGTFRVRLVVTDSTGAVSSNDAVVTLNSVPTEGLHVQLSWSSDSNDLDLHLGRDIPVDWCSHDDCYYGNCEITGLNWDGAAGGHGPGDPSLDIDDVRGFGPENISVDQPSDGTYVVAVHAYDGNGDGPGFTATDVTVKIFLGGALAGEFVTHFDARNQFWRVARLDVVGGQVAVTPVDTVQTAPAACAS